MTRRYLVLGPTGAVFASSNYLDAAERWVRLMGSGYRVVDSMALAVAA